MSTSLSKTAAKLGSSDSTDQMGGTAGYDSCGEKTGRAVKVGGSGESRTSPALCSRPSAPHARGRPARQACVYPRQVPDSRSSCPQRRRPTPLHQPREGSPQQPPCRGQSGRRPLPFGWGREDRNEAVPPEPKVQGQQGEALYPAPDGTPQRPSLPTAPLGACHPLRPGVGCRAPHGRLGERSPRCSHSQHS